jgi:hypothetical protein
VAGGGLPAITQVAGGDWDYPLGTITVPTGTTSAVTAAMLSDARTYSYTLGSQDSINGELTPENAAGMYKQLIVNPATKVIQWAAYAESRRNHLDNPTFLNNQRGQTSIVGPSSGVICDRWRATLSSSAYSLSLVSSTAPADQVGGNVPRALQIISNGVAVAPSSYFGIYQVIEGYAWAKLFNQPLVLSWWDWSSVAATYCFQLRNGATNVSFVHPYSVPANTWTYNWAYIPPVSIGTWNFTNGAGAYLDFATATGTGSFQATVADAWINGNFVGHTSMTNNLTSNGYGHYIVAPKLEIGHLPSRFVIPDFIEDQMKCLRQLWRLTITNSGGRFTTGVCVGASDVQYYIIPPVQMRVDPPSFSVNNIATILTNAISPRTMTSLAISSGLSSQNMLGIQAGGVAGTNTLGAVYELFTGTVGDWIQFSAELQ